MKKSEIKKMLFVGMYPNEVERYRNIFFQNLIFAIADTGVECTVISPVSITKYRQEITAIPLQCTHRTASGKEIKVYYPRYCSVSSKQIGMYNTEKLSEYLFEKSAMSAANKIEEKFDLVYGHFFLYGGLAAIQIGRKKNIPVFIAYGECDYSSQIGDTYGRISEKKLKGLTGIISVSTDNTNELKALKIAQNVPIKTIPNAVDAKVFRKKNKVECRKRLGLPIGKFIVGFVGGFIERKGDKRVLSAVNMLRDIYVAFVGKGKNSPHGEKVIFCRSLQHREVSDFLNAIDVFCLPTLSEGCCNAVIEAMACGAPIISSNLPFNWDIINGDNAILVDPMNINEIKEAISFLKENPEERKRLEKKSLVSAKNLTIEKRAKKILEFIEEVRQ